MQVPKHNFKKMLLAVPILLLLNALIFGFFIGLFSPESFQHAGEKNGWFYIFTGSMAITFFSTLLNLMYLFPTKNLKLKFMSPGLIGIFVFLFGIFTFDPFVSLAFLLGSFMNLLVGGFFMKRSV